MSVFSLKERCITKGSSFLHQNFSIIRFSSRVANIEPEKSYICPAQQRTPDARKLTIHINCDALHCDGGPLPHAGGPTRREFRRQILLCRTINHLRECYGPPIRPFVPRTRTHKRSSNPPISVFRSEDTRQVHFRSHTQPDGPTLERKSCLSQRRAFAPSRQRLLYLLAGENTNIAFFGALRCRCRTSDVRHAVIILIPIRES